MKAKIVLLLATFLWMGCAAYKHLEPKPEISNREDGYIELTNDDERFELKEDKNYYIKFPAPQFDNFYLVLDITNKDLIRSGLYRSFDDEGGGILTVDDVSEQPQTQSVFAVDSDVQTYYWVIDSVLADFKLNMTYRYTPQWRFVFENKHARFKEILAQNSADRELYQSIGTTFHFEDFDFDARLQGLQSKQAALENLQQQFSELETLFPVDIVNTSDPAYQDYLSLKEIVKEEIDFQKDFIEVVRVFKAERESRGRTSAFNEVMPVFNAFFEKEQRFPAAIVDEARSVIAGRLNELQPYFDRTISAKTEATPIDLNVDAALALFDHVSQSPDRGFRSMASFISEYNDLVAVVSEKKKSVETIETKVNAQRKMPSDFFFSDLLTNLSKIDYAMPKTSRGTFGQYADYRCVEVLFSEINRLRRTINRLQSQFRRADKIVPQINSLKARKDYSGMLRLLKQNPELEFLHGMYKGIDQLSLNEQRNSIQRALKNRNWRQAEENLRALHQDDNFLNPREILPAKNRLVKTLEDSLWQAVGRVSTARANRFVEDNLDTVEGVESLYDNPAFLPVHEITYTTGSQRALEERRQKLLDRLNYLKEVTFPAKAIENLYSRFTRNPNQEGVQTARAVVAHGQHYRGNDAKIRNRINECDPLSAKWITSARDYRRVFALPTTTNPQGTNTYIFRINLRIPSDAQFPVFDVNVKLPKEVARSAASQQWYENITMNDEVIKNEGRYTITAPIVQNDYECQITPLQMRKNEDNILEIRFDHASFKVFEVSVMAQKPIIKKH